MRAPYLRVMTRRATRTASEPMTKQLAFDLTPEPALRRADFVPAAANALALGALDAPQSWPQGRMLLIGPEGAGKSHMAAFWAEAQGAACVPAAGLHPDQADALAPAKGALVVEDADRIASEPAAQEALFHLWNLAPMRGCLLLLTARSAPRDWGVSLPDLASRMDAMPQIRLGAPDEALLTLVLVKLFADRQLSVSDGVVSWLARRMERDLGLARRLVAALDARALAQKTPVSRRDAAELLDKLTAPDA